MSARIPRIVLIGATITDGRGEDAEGRCLSVEWLGLIVELTVARRARPKIDRPSILRRAWAWLNAPQPPETPDEWSERQW